MSDCELEYMPPAWWLMTRYIMSNRLAAVNSLQSNIICTRNIHLKCYSYLYVYSPPYLDVNWEA